MARMIAYYAGTRQERNRVVFDRAVQRQTRPKTDFVCLVGNRHRRRQLELIYLEKHPFCFDVPILTFQGLIGRLLEDSGFQTTLSEAARLLLLEEITDSRKTTGTAGVEHNSGLLRRVSRGIVRLKEQNILEPELLALSSGKRPQDFVSDELVWYFSRYQARLEALGVEDWWGQQALVYRGLLTGAIRLPERLSASRSLVVEGFTDMTPVEHSILRHLRDAVDELVVSTDLEPGPADKQEPSRFHEMRSFLSNPDLEWRSVAGPGPETRPGVVCLPSVEDEAVWVAEKIAGRKCKTRPRVAIVSTRPGIYRMELTRALGGRGVELGEAGGASAAASGNLGLLQDYLSLILERFPRQHLFDFLNHPRLSTGLTSDDLHGIERWAIACDVREGFRNWSIDFPARVLKALENLPDDSPFSSSEIGPALAAFSNVMCRLSVGSEQHSRSQWLALLERRLLPFLRPLPADDLLKVREENLIMQGLLHEIELLDNQFPELLELQQFARCVKIVGESMLREVGLDPPRCILARPKEVEHLEVDVLIWMGLTDREFLPRVAGSRFPEHDSVHQSASIWEEQAREQGSQFRWMRGQASSSVIYTLPGRVFGAPSLVNPLLRGLPVEELTPLEPLPALDAAVQDNVQRGRQALLSRENSSATAFNGFLTSQESLRAVRRKLGEGSRILVSPSLLEDYMRCGFRFLAEHCLDLEKESWTPELDSSQLGSLVHRVLYRFMKDLEPPAGLDAGHWDRRAAGRLQGLLEAELESWPLRETRQKSLTWTVQEEFLRAGLQPGDAMRGVFSDFLLHQSRWLRHHQVEALEQKLDVLSLGNAMVDSGQVEVLLTGTVDRVDRGSRGLVVIDYKSGRIPLGRLYQGWGFQLPLYYLLVRNHYREEVETAFFFHVEPPFEARPRTVGLPDSDNRGWPALAESYRDLALEATRAILSGKFPVTLVGASQAGCRECNFRDACRMDPAKTDRLRDSGHFPIARPLLTGGQWVGPRETPQQGVGGV